MLVLEILPAAIGIAISPLPIMIVVLLLVAGNSRSAVYYVLGWLAGILAVGIGLVFLADRFVSQREESQADAVAWASILMGAFFLLFGYLAWRGVKAKRAKQRALAAGTTASLPAEPVSSAEPVPSAATINSEGMPGSVVATNTQSVALATASVAPASTIPEGDVSVSTEGLPAWMRAIDKVSPLLAVAVALVSAFNPKNFSMILLAIGDINEAEVGPIRGSLAYLNFAALATLSVAVPVLYWYFDRVGSEVRLKQWQRWLADHQQEIMMWLFGVLGTLALIKGIQKLF